MAGLDFCSKHNMVAYLEKNDRNTEIMDFLTHSSIHFALTISPIVSTSFVEQFWTTAKSRTAEDHFDRSLRMTMWYDNHAKGSQKGADDHNDEEEG
ncbi:hypothetical protein Tco_0718287 [Tanacetum coccineum]